MRDQPGTSWPINKAEGLNRRPKLLFLAHSFPPARTSGSVRSWNIAKYLTRLGWDVVVVTPHPDVWRKVDNPDEVEASLQRQGIQRICTDHRWRCLFYDRLRWRDQGFGRYAGGICRVIARGLGMEQGMGWVHAAERACATLTANEVDVILATGLPFAAFKLAKRVAHRLHRPYVLDYRDPWTGNPHTAQPTRRVVIQQEAELLADCAAVTIVSPSWGEALVRRFGIAPKLHVVPNGYDPEELIGIEPHNFGHFAIVYTGNFYPPKRVISPVMAALKRLKETMHEKGVMGYFHYYGSHIDHVREEAKRFGVMDVVVSHGNVPRIEALAAVKGAGVAVVITSVADEATLADRGVMTGKVFEPLGLGTPILLVAPPGSDVEILANTTGLARRFRGSDIAGIASFLAEIIAGKVIEPKNRDAYAWPHLATRLDAVLREVAVSGRCYQSR